MRTFPIKDNGGTVFAFEIPAQLLGWRLARRLRDIPGVCDVRPRKWWVGSPDVHIRFRYHDREFIVWEPYGDNSRWWIGPDDESAPHIPLNELERAIARSQKTYWRKRMRRRGRWTVDLTREEVAMTIENFLEGLGGQRDWDNFISFPITDPRLDEIRERCNRLSEEFPAAGCGHYCGPGGVEVMRAFVRELRELSANNPPH